jgi:hypothetical protein
MEMKLDNEELEIGSEVAEMVSVIEVEPLENYKLRVSLSNGRKGIFDMSTFLNKGVFNELKDPEYFRRVSVKYDTVVWPHEQDIAPETVEYLLQLEPAPKKTRSKKTNITK